MPRSFTLEQDNLPDVVKGWLRAAQLDDTELIELIFTDGEVLLRRPASPQLREWSRGVADQYDQAFRELTGL
ncbi:MAG: hypothetical protein GFH27_549279n165 [Chloroflexi bacterium AL-W]|nr:hypothetical protein [Chloroflexi bacterium AL-N1]NOK65131.1 hypothetical protein [Chloroflexi bacterium AL-N10]NOK72602.1 hypothetical protein [Chloroflexi bacterium AL-N5]NOK79310.1 hypothetical protein [Chloroflexi bacterium AL-W]NOK87226.1 hypothetical protein [Chloroflexi bacterium AL-N15]